MDDTFSVKVTTDDVNGQQFRYHDTDTPLAVFNFATLQQWRIDDGPVIQHPSHIHVYHMQIVSPGGCGGIYEEGQWFDTIAPTINDCRVRFKPMDVGGFVLFHCHIPLHAEGGAMGHILVEGGPPNIDEVRGDEIAADTCSP